MATREELLAEAYRRGLMPPQQRTAYEEAQRRGIVKGPAASNKPANTIDAITGALATFNRNALPFMDEAADALQAASNLAQGRAQSLPEAWQQARQASSGSAQRFETATPRAAALTRGVGLAAQAAVPAGVAGRAIAAAPTLTQAAVRSAAAGATAGGVGGFAAGEGRNRSQMALQGAGMGAVVGGAVPYAVPALNAVIQRAAPIAQRGLQLAAPAVDEIGQAIPGVGDLSANLAGRMRSMGPEVPPLSSPEAIALRHLQRVAQSSGVGIEDLRNAPQDIFAAEALGRTGQRQLGALARREGQTGDILEQAVAERRLARPNVLQNEFARATGVTPEAAAGDIETLVDAGRRASAPLYEAAYRDAIEMTPVLSDLSRRPTVQRAMNNARRMMLDDGLDPSVVGLEVSPASGDIPEMVKVTRPSLQTWDYVKRGLDDELERLRDTTTGKLPRTNQVRQITELAQTLRNELTSQSPNYRAALANSADYLSTNNAFDRAKSLLTNNRVTEREFATAVGKMSDGERSALRAGVANWAFDLVQTGKMTPRVLSQPRIRAKLTAALGEDGAADLITTAEREVQKAAFENRYGFVNSTTDELRAAGQELEEGLGGAQKRSLGQMFMSPISSARDLAAQGIDYGIARMTQPGQVQARDILGQRLTMSPQELADYLEANQVNIAPPIFPRRNAPNPFAFTPPAPTPSRQPRR
jgi:hypothetical protein